MTEPKEDLLKATGPDSIVLAAIRRHHEPADGCSICAHDDIAGLLNIVKRAHDGLVSLYGEIEQLRAKVAELESQLAGHVSGMARLVDDHEIAAEFGVGLEIVNRWMVYGDDFEPPFPEPVRVDERRAEPSYVYSLAEVKAWHERVKPEA